jgi:transposase-like protein
MPDEMVTRQPGARYLTPPQIDAGLRVVVRHGGSATVAARELGIPVNTVESWKKRHRERYHQLREEMGPELERQAQQGFLAFVTRAEEAKAKALEAVVEGLDAGTVKDPARALQQVSISQGIAVQKVLELSGRPTSIVEHRSVAETIAQLRSLGAEIIEGTVVSSDEPVREIEAGGD